MPGDIEENCRKHYSGSYDFKCVLPEYKSKGITTAPAYFFL
jgi:hypothetical protein